MPTRKYHHKSTTGCAECKGARVKCDENKPECTRCARQGRSCSYTRQNAVPSPASSSGGAQVNPDEFISVAAYHQDIELLHHYSVHACISLSHEATIRKLWQQTAVTLGLKYPFLLRAIYAFSALHLSNTLPAMTTEQVSSPGPSQSSHAESSPGPSPSTVPPTNPANSTAAATDNNTPTRLKWYERAVADYGHALALARPELENINEKNCNAALLFSSLIAYIRLAMPQVTGEYGPDGILGYVMETFHLLRGKAAISDAAMPWILRGPLKRAMADREEKQPRDIPAPILEVLERFEQMARSEAQNAAASGGDGNDAEARLKGYLFAVAGVKAYFACEPGNVAATRISAAWPVRLAPLFMADLRNSEPLALAILAYYAVMLDDQREFWWVGDTGKQLLLQIAQEVGGDWAAALSPAREHMELEIDYWTQMVSLRLFDQGGEDGRPFVGFVNSQDLLRGERTGEGLSGGENHKSPSNSGYSMNSSYTTVEEDETLSAEPAVQESPFGVSLSTGELPGQKQVFFKHE